MSDIYKHSELVHNLRAPREMIPLIISLVHPKSVLDVGCGIGTWLKAFEEHGIFDYLGVDGSYVDRRLLKIPDSKFYAQDLDKTWSVNRKFDLVVSLEVAEHLEKSSAENFVSTLVSHGDVILFSAAIPGQGGQYHLNEQWLSYWSELFGKHNYNVYDVIRPNFWTNSSIEVWYKQNMVLLCKQGHTIEKNLQAIPPHYIIDIVHPELFSFYTRQAERAILYEQGELGIRTAFHAFIRSILRKFR